MPKERHAPTKLVTMAALVLFMTARYPSVPSAQEMANKNPCAELTKADELLRRRAADEKKSSKDSAKANSMRAVGETVSTAARKINELEQTREEAQQKFITSMVVGALQEALASIALSSDVPQGIARPSSQQSVVPPQKVQTPSRLASRIKGASALVDEADKACREGKRALAAAKAKEALELLQ